MIPVASNTCVGVASPLTLVDDVDLVNGDFGISFAQACDVFNKVLVLLWIKTLIFVEHGAYEVDVQVLVDEYEGDREDEEPEEEEVATPLDDYHDEVEGGATEDDPEDRALYEV